MPTPNEQFRKIVLSMVTTALKPRGYRRSGATYSRVDGDLIRCANVQASVSSNAAQLIITENLALYSESVNQLFNSGDVIGYRNWLDNHWQQRIGWYMSDRRDHWWSASSETEAQAAALEIITVLIERALPELERPQATSDVLQMIAGGRKGPRFAQQASGFLTSLESNPPINGG